MLTLVQRFAGRSGAGARRAAAWWLYGAAVFGLVAACGENDGEMEAANPGGREPTADAAAYPGDAAATRVLTASASALNIDAQGRAPFHAKLQEKDGSPVPGEVVTFALSGAAQDSSLETLSATTDEDGIAGNAILAGSVATSFEVRISAPGALPATVTVSTASQGLEALDVLANYQGGRAVDTRVISVFTARTCAQFEGAGDPLPETAQTIVLADHNQSDAARFYLLPLTPYTVRALARSASGTVLATACLDDVTVEPGEITSRSLTWQHRPLALQGMFDVHATLDVEQPAQQITNAMAAAMNQRLSTPSLSGFSSGATVGGETFNLEALYLIDALQRTMRSETFALSGLSDTVMGQALPTFTSELQLALDDAQAGPATAIETLREDTFASIKSAELWLQLAFDPVSEEMVGSGEECTVRVRPVALSGQMIDETREPPTVDFDAGAAQEAVGTYDLEDDGLTMEMSAALPLRSLADQAMRQVAARRTENDELAIAAALGCNVLSAWWIGGELGPECDADCIQAACDLALTSLLTASSGALGLEAPPETSPVSEATLRTTLTLADEDGDLVPDALHSDEVDGTWGFGETLGGEFSGSLTGSVAEAAL